MSADGGDCETVLEQFGKVGVDVDALASQLQQQGADGFVSSWNELIAVIASKGDAMKRSTLGEIMLKPQYYW